MIVLPRDRLELDSLGRSVGVGGSPGNSSGRSRPRPLRRWQGVFFWGLLPFPRPFFPAPRPCDPGSLYRAPTRPASLAGSVSADSLLSGF